MNYTAAASAEVLLVFHIFLLADDNYLFKQECQKMQYILQKFENLSSKAVNFQKSGKSGIFFSNNVLDSLRRCISNCLIRGVRSFEHRKVSGPILPHWEK